MSALKKALIITFRNRRGGLTEWLRSSPGKRVGCNSLVGSSPMSSAKFRGSEKSLPFRFFVGISRVRDFFGNDFV